MGSADPYRYFRIEARDLVDQLGRGAATLTSGSDAAAITRLLRLAHTLKGAARVVRLADVADTAHAIEDLLAPLRAPGATPPRDLPDRLVRLIDSIAGRLDALAVPPSPAVALTGAPKRPASLAEGAAVPGEIDALIDGLTHACTLVAALTGDERQAATAGRPADGLIRRPEHGARLLSGPVDEVAGELRDLRDLAERLRLVPVTHVVGSLERTARDAAALLGRRIIIAATGDGLRLDAETARHLLDALVQLVRNAVAHGIESPDDRIAAGKSPEGRLELAVEMRGNQIRATCADDGRGVDEAALRASAGDPGASLADLLLGAEQTTARDVTQVSGRGVGMSVVAAALESLGGTMSVHSAPGRGARFELTVPRRLSLTDALIVEAGGRRAALPAAAIRATHRLRADEVSAGTVSVDPDPVPPFLSLAAVLGAQADDAIARFGVVLGEGAAPVVLGIDRLLGVASVLVRPLPALAPRLPLMSGVFIDALGEIVPVLDPASILPGPVKSQVWPARRRGPLLLIDDSATARMAERAVLEAAGHAVDVADTGEAGLERARAGNYAAILCDIEMPGMDGFAVLEELRRDPRLRHTPAILVTSRDTPEDRWRGAAAGARAYVVKGTTGEAELVARLAGLLG